MRAILFRVGFPYPVYVRRILVRTCVMWVLVKLFIPMVCTVFGISTPMAALLLPSLGIPALLVFVDRVRAGERLLNASLGASEWWLAILTLGLSLALDAVSLAVASTAGVL